MGNAKHTPGPWEFDVEADEITTPDRIKQNKVCIAIVETGWDEPFESEQQANARLIAAAPELLEALIEQDSFLGVLAGTVPLSEKDTHRRIQINREAVRAAIAKATGEK